ncbi:hypothetical protein CPB86DRAFT_80554 [Serendipita vermifera]|nr:hypothetical protein CPB86DRAFT_80554 [Serendipita vermifera]
MHSTQRYGSRRCRRGDSLEALFIFKSLALCAPETNEAKSKSKTGSILFTGYSFPSLSAFLLLPLSTMTLSFHNLSALPSQRSSASIRWPDINTRDSRDLIQTLADAMDAHHSLYRYRILHRDISLNSIFINTETRRGLLVDLDLAKNLLDTTAYAGYPRITGTVYYISLALVHAPVHQYWHDLESFFWVATHAIFRHLEGLSVGGRDIDSMESRTKLLGDVFPFFRGEDGFEFEQVSRAKQAFLGTHVSVTGCPNLSHAMLKTSKDLNHLYATVKAISTASLEVRDLFESALQQPVHNTDPAGHYQAERPEDLAKALDLLSRDICVLEEIKGPLASLREDVQRCKDSINTQIFPLYETTIGRWRDALLDPPAACISYIPSKEISLNDLLVGVTRRTSQQLSLDPLIDSPTKHLHRKRKSSQRDVSRPESNTRSRKFPRL